MQEKPEMTNCALVEQLSLEEIHSISGGSFVVTAPDSLNAAASDLAGIGSQLSVANTAAIQTTNLQTAGADEVSSSIAALFGALEKEFQAVSGQAAAFHSQFVNTLSAGAASYAQS
jgi:ABC-type anion transport system duplicated permease subunit